ncbi:MAG TPA: hypothetical protein VLG09_01375 [Candidatus Saccharimonadales bacterium]|nr:hypothetical protein [Candidatus Saccharimonadales bacterium]
MSTATLTPRARARGYAGMGAPKRKTSTSTSKPVLKVLNGTIVDRQSQNPVYLRGAGVNANNCLDNTMFRCVKTLLGGNFLTIRITWGDYEPKRPLGGDPSLGTFQTRRYDSAMEQTLLRILQWCEINQIYNVVRTGHTGGDGVPYFNPAKNNGWPDWLYNPNYWASQIYGPIDDLPPQPQYPPLPAFRNEYGGGYDPNDQGSANADSASWMPETEWVSSTDTKGVRINPGSIPARYGWHGDANKQQKYLLPFLQHIQDIVQPFRYCVGFNWFNEPDYGELAKTVNYNSNKLAVERMIRTQAELYYSKLRATDPYRWHSAHGQGGHNWLGIQTNIITTPDMSWYWGGGGGKCPGDIFMCYENHMYPSHQDTMIAPDYVLSGDCFNQETLGGLVCTTGNKAIYAPTGGSPSTIADANANIFYNKCASWNIPNIVGEYGMKANVTNRANFIADMHHSFRINKTHCAFFALSAANTDPSNGNACLLDLGNDNYSLNTMGAAIASQLAIPY